MKKIIYCLLISTILTNYGYTVTHPLPSEEIEPPGTTSAALSSPQHSEISIDYLQAEISKLKIEKQEKEKECEELKCEIEKLRGDTTSSKDADISKGISTIEEKYKKLIEGRQKKAARDEVRFKEQEENAKNAAEYARSRSIDAQKRNAFEEEMYWRKEEYQKRDYEIQYKDLIEKNRRDAELEYSRYEEGKKHDIEVLTTGCQPRFFYHFEQY